MNTGTVSCAPSGSKLDLERAQCALNVMDFASPLRLHAVQCGVSVHIVLAQDSKRAVIRIISRHHKL
jgi:hypothetical protein